MEMRTPSNGSWVEIPHGSDFTLANLPYGIFSTADRAPRVGVAIGDQVLDIYAVATLGHLDELRLDASIFLQTSLNAFVAQGRPTWQALRAKLIALLASGDSPLQAHAAKVLLRQDKVQLHLPVQVGDYTDFYSSEEHARNVGTMFRDPDKALLPNWKHIPVGYHGRASSIVVSGTPIHRPKGQTLPKGAEVPVFGPSQRMDFELEMAFICGSNTKLGQAISTAQADEHIFGMVLFNDWSARDIQKWEYVPLGPFLGKNFASSISPWVVTLDALESFRVAGPTQEPKVLPYLAYEGKKNFDINLEVYLEAEDQGETLISCSNSKYLYWNIAQQLAHHTVNGCNIKVGDMMASGTISGKSPDAYGSLLELAWAGQKPITLSGGAQRRFIEDYDTITFKAYAEREGLRVGFGKVEGQLLPAL